MIVYEKPAEYRGTIEVYAIDALPADNSWVNGNFVLEWRFRVKARNNQIVGHGEGYKRRAGALNAIDAQYAVKLTPAGIADTDERRTKAVVPWRLVIHDRHGNIERIGAVH